MIHIHITIVEEEGGFVRVRGESDDKGPTRKEVDMAKQLLMAISERNKKGWEVKETTIPLTIIETRKKKNEHTIGEESET